MLKSNSTYLSLFFIIFIISFGVKGQSVVKDLSYDFELSRNDQKEISIFLEVNDEIQLDITSSSLTNLFITDPTSQSLKEISTKKSTENWSHVSTVTGLYKLSFKNMSRIKGSSVNVVIKVTKLKSLLDFPCRDSIEIEEKETVLSNGQIAISKGKDKSYSFNVVRGDQFKFELVPNAKKTPSVEIAHSSGETLLLSPPVSKEISLNVPVWTDGSLTINLKSKSYLNTVHVLNTSVTSPEKYYGCVEVPVVEVPTVVVPPFDTVPMLILDTTIFLGAQRDPINKSEGQINFEINERDVLSWAILYGAGEKFNQQMEYFKKNLEGEPMEKGIADLLSAYSVGLIEKLPSYTSGDTKIRCPNISKKHFSQIHPNYAVIKGAPRKQSIQFGNRSESSGQKVYIYIVLLRKQLIEE